MDMCNACADRQQWLLDSGDGSQVLCLCQVENSQVEDGEVATTIDVGVQTSKRMSSPIKTTDAPKRKMQRMDRKFWMNSGCDIRRNLFRDHDLEVVKRVQDRKWAILKIETIATSPSHQCIR